MNISSELLMRYYDGELSADEAREVEAELELRPELIEQLTGLDQVGDFVRTLSEQRSAQPTLDISNVVMQRIAAEQQTVARSNVVQRRAPRRMRYFAPAVFGAVTLAAAFAVWLRVGPSAERPVSPAVTANVRSQTELVEAPAVEALPAAPEVAEGAEVAIESVDFGAKTGTIFVVSGAGSETPVVWLADDADAQKRRIESL